MLLRWAGSDCLSQVRSSSTSFGRGDRGAIEYHAGEAFHAAIDRFGLKWGGLQDMATSPYPSAHPYLYIHHPNFGLYFSFPLRKVGLRGFEIQMAFGTLLWSAGIVVFTLVLRALTGSETLALAGAALVGLDPGNALEYGCNIHRAADFGSAALTLLAALHFVTRPGLVHRGLLAVSLGLAMGADYIMFIFLTLFALLLAMGRAAVSWTGQASEASGTTGGGAPGIPSFWHKPALAVVIPVVGVGALASTVFLGRQVQELAGAGREIWMRDIGFQILNRTHNERLYSGQWSQDTTDFYEKQSVLNPGFAPKNPVSVRFEVTGRTLSRQLSFYFIGNRPAWSWTFGAQGKLVFLALVFLVIGLLARQPPPTGDRSPVSPMPAGSCY